MMFLKIDWRIKPDSITFFIKEIFEADDEYSQIYLQNKYILIVKNTSIDS